MAEKMFTLGAYKRGHFEELTKQYLFLPIGQNEKLSKNMMMEQVFKKYENDRRFGHIFDFKNKLVKLGKEMRIAQRPLVLAVGTTTDLSRHLRYPVSGPHSANKIVLFNVHCLNYFSCQTFYLFLPCSPL